MTNDQGPMTPPPPLTILFAGSGEFGVPTLRAIVAAGHRVPLVVTQPDKPAGRGAKLTPTPVAVAAETLGLPVLKTAAINKESLPAADLLVVIAFGQKIGPHVIAAPRLGAVNLHASRLPRYRGAAPINWAILAGETVAGNSVIRLADKMDAGAVLAMSAVPIGELETAGELHDRLSEDGVGLTLGVVADLAAGRAVETEQDHAAATLAPKLSRESAKLDFAKPAVEVARQIRGLSPWPGCRVRVLSAAGEPVDAIRLVRARAVAGTAGMVAAGTTSLDAAAEASSRPAATTAPPPGTILPDGTVAAGDFGAVEMVEVQPDGKRPMKLADYRRGHEWAAGMRLEGM
jgi:methionyl-tRNA formyltransferase